MRIGAAIHTPTWYSLSTSYVGEMSSQTMFPSGNHENYNFNDYTDDAYFDWNLKTPWKFMIGAAGVIGGRGIISVDYQYDAYGSMKTSDSQGDFDIFNQGVKNYFKSTNTLRIGGEYRINPQFSVRAGYNYSSTAVNLRPPMETSRLLRPGPTPDIPCRIQQTPFLPVSDIEAVVSMWISHTSTVTQTQPGTHSPISRITMEIGWKLLLQRLI